MQRRYKDFIGHRFNRLILLEVLPEEVKKWGRFKCDCGTIKKILCQSVFQNKTKSCGCFHGEVLSERAIHSLSTHPLYKVWYGMMARCFKKEHPSYCNYGGRGIGVCLAWYSNPIDFIKWGIQNGWQKGLKLDRIINDDHYGPSNCRFVTSYENNMNRRNTISFEYNGRQKPILEWALEIGMKYNTLRNRIRKGWDIKKAIETPANQNLNRYK